LLGGAIGFYAFVECSKGDKFVTTSKVHNGEALYQAICEAVLFFKRYGHYSVIWVPPSSQEMVPVSTQKSSGEGDYDQILAAPPITVPVPQVISPKLKIGAGNQG
jgi:hypothetical protein